MLNTNDNESAMVTFMLRIEDSGTGNLPANCTELRASMKTISGKLSLVLSIAEHDNIEISQCFLNGIRREISVEPEALRSIIFITEKQWRSRKFSINNRISNNYYLEEEVDTDTKKNNSEDEENVDTDAEKDNIGIDAGTNMNNNVKTNVHNKKGKERYFIYKKATKTYREAIPFKDSIIREDEVDDVTTDDPRKGGKLKENMSQKNILGGESLYNRVYQGLAGLSNAVTSGFLPLKKTVGKISENMKEMLRFRESQVENIRIEEEMSTKELERKVNEGQAEVRDDSSQCYDILPT